MRKIKGYKGQKSPHVFVLKLDRELNLHIVKSFQPYNYGFTRILPFPEICCLAPVQPSISFVHMQNRNQQKVRNLLNSSRCKQSEALSSHRADDPVDFLSAIVLYFRHMSHLQSTIFSCAAQLSQTLQTSDSVPRMGDSHNG